jgi:hypothetical protein
MKERLRGYERMASIAQGKDNFDQTIEAICMAVSRECFTNAKDWLEWAQLSLDRNPKECYMLRRLGEYLMTTASDYKELVDFSRTVRFFSRRVIHAKKQ